jgi:hypothetical protein
VVVSSHSATAPVATRSQIAAVSGGSATQARTSPLSSRCQGRWATQTTATVGGATTNSAASTAVATRFRARIIAGRHGRAAAGRRGPAGQCTSAVRVWRCRIHSREAHQAVTARA